MFIAAAGNKEVTRKKKSGRRGYTMINNNNPYFNHIRGYTMLCDIQGALPGMPFPTNQGGDQHQHLLPTPAINLSATDNKTC